MEAPHVIPVHLLLGTAAKVLCSGVFLSGRDEEEAWRNSAFHALQNHHLPHIFYPLVTKQVDRERREVILRMRFDESSVKQIVNGYREAYPNLIADWPRETERLLRLGTVARTARFLGDQGSVILRQGDDRIFFDPVPVQTKLPDSASLPWPMGDADDGPQNASPADRKRISNALKAAIEDPAASTRAVVVVHRGVVVGEDYGKGFDRQTQMESWSMGKSVTATLIGRLIRMGHLALEQPAPISAWQHPDDPRHRITIRDLLQMSSGLQFSGFQEERQTWNIGMPDHFYIYNEAIDVFEFAITRPPEFPPQTVGRYRNCDPLSLGYIIKQVVTRKLGENYLRWPQAELFDRIGVRRQVLETDLYGNFIMTGFDYGTARNWARLGLLYLRDGICEGERLLPEGYVRFVSSPAPAWPEPVYGGLFRLNTMGEWELPTDAFMMSGSGFQRVFVVPSADLVVVRMGHVCSYQVAKPSINVMLREILAALGGSY
jgi:CubicO group peptidase (beta-lactamase class C family)